jgi:hypothetical protein
MPGLSPRNLVCLRALVATVFSLARTLDSSWFAALEAFQDADYVLTTRGTATPGRVPDYLIAQLAKGLTAELAAPII